MLYTEDVCGAAELLIWSHFFSLITHQHGPTPESLLTTLLTNLELPQFADPTNLPLSNSVSRWWKILAQHIEEGLVFLAPTGALIVKVSY